MEWKDIIKMPNAGIMASYGPYKTEESTDGRSLRGWWRTSEQEKLLAEEFADFARIRDWVVNGPIVVASGPDQGNLFVEIIV
tara:strand:+ start:443 stop:688 length:246 start_codon:yes stop_codon:yes gene_type:complete